MCTYLTNVLVYRTYQETLQKVDLKNNFKNVIHTHTHTYLTYFNLKEISIHALTSHFCRNQLIYRLEFTFSFSMKLFFSISQNIFSVYYFSSETFMFCVFYSQIFKLSFPFLVLTVSLVVCSYGFASYTLKFF